MKQRLKTFVILLSIGSFMGGSLIASTLLASAAPSGFSAPLINPENQYLSLELQVKTESSVRKSSVSERDELLKTFDQTAGSVEPLQRLAILDTLVTTLETAAALRRQSYSLGNNDEFNRAESNIAQFRVELSERRREIFDGRTRTNLPITRDHQTLHAVIGKIIQTKTEVERRQLLSDFVTVYQGLTPEDKIALYNSLLSAMLEYRHVINNQGNRNAAAIGAAGACTVLAITFAITKTGDTVSFKNTFLSRFFGLGAVMTGLSYIATKPGLDQLYANLSDLEKEILNLRRSAQQEAKAQAM